MINLHFLTLKPSFSEYFALGVLLKGLCYVKHALWMIKYNTILAQLFEHFALHRVFNWSLYVKLEFKVDNLFSVIPVTLFCCNTWFWKHFLAPLVSDVADTIWRMFKLLLRFSWLNLWEQQLVERCACSWVKWPCCFCIFILLIKCT